MSCFLVVSETPFPKDLLRGRAAFVHAGSLQLRWVEGLLDVDKVSMLLGRHPNAHVLCGHIHRGGDHYFSRADEPQIFVANAVVDHESPLRLYEAIGDRLYTVEEATHTIDPFDALSPLVA